MMLFYISLVFIMFPVVTFSQAQACAKLTLIPLKDNIISLFENSFLNVTFGIDASSCDFRTSYLITVHTRTLDGNSEYDGSMTLLRDGTCSDTRNTSVHCISPKGPGQLYRKVNRSHVQTQWEWKWKDPQSGSFVDNQTELKLNVLYLPSVISMTINGHEVNSRQLINEGQINISCLFDKGNPSADCSLLDRNRKQLHHLRSENLLIYSLTVQCKDEWPVLHCEGKGSDKKRSVSLLVKCRPQFVDKHPKVISDTEHEKWIFNVRAHTTKLESCFLSSLPLEENSNKEVKCTLTGDPPDLLLTVELNKEDSVKEGEWTLSLRNEKGFSDPLVFSKISPNQTAGKDTSLPGIVSVTTSAELLGTFSSGLLLVIEAEILEFRAPKIPSVILNCMHRVDKHDFTDATDSTVFYTLGVTREEMGYIGTRL